MIGNRPPDNPPGEHVEDAAAVDLAGLGRVFGDVGAPDLIRPCGDESSFDEIIVHCWCDVQIRAGHRDGEPVGGEFTDQPEPYFGRMFSGAKYADGV